MPARTNRILEILTERERVEVSALAEELDVSQVTMRKDLTELERRGLIRREHGFAVLRSADNVEGRLAYHYEEKRRSPGAPPILCTTATPSWWRAEAAARCSWPSSLPRDAT